MSDDKRVIIVGAGPAGLVTALGLAKKAIQVTLIDQDSGVNDSPRANAYLPSTIKVLDELGVLDDAKAAAVVGYEYQLRFALTGNIGRLNHHSIEGLTPYAYILFFGQHVLAEILLKHLNELPNVTISWNTAFTGVEQHADGVRVTVNTPAGPQTLEGAWLIGADGARSSVRRAIGVEFDGFTWPECFMATNVYYDFERHGYSYATMIADKENWAVITKIDSQNLWRVAYQESSEVAEATRVARIPEHYRRYIPEGQPYELARANSYRVHQRAATSFRVGRVLLAGDAAHSTNPIGGFGFTSGVQDADALVKYLPAFMTGEAAEDILDWYAYERRRVFLKVANPTAIEMKRRLQETDPAVRVQDEKNFFALMADRKQVEEALMSIFLMSGRPYQPDWKTTLLKQDQAISTTAATPIAGAAATAKSH